MTLNGVRSEAESARLSATENPRYDRRAYVTSIDERDRICCCQETLRFQSEGRTPQPFRMPGSKLLVSTFCPNSVFDTTPQRSPPLGRRSCAFGLDRSQSGTKFWFASVHARVTPAVPNVEVVCGIRS